MQESAPGNQTNSGNPSDVLLYPNAKSELPVDLEDFDFDAPISPESQAIQAALERQWAFSSHYIDPVRLAEDREADNYPPIDPAEFDEWLQGLDPAEKAELDALKAGSVEYTKLADMVHNKLTQSVPELYEAHLPPALEARLGGTSYALGFNQTSAETSEEATEYINLNNGIDVTDHSLDQRFLIFDQTSVSSQQEYITRAIEVGYTGEPKIGRFVVVFPEAHPENNGQDERLRYAVSIDESILPDDLKVSNPLRGEGSQSVNAKYVAGFIDGQGDFWPNQNFMRESIPDLRTMLEPSTL